MDLRERRLMSVDKRLCYKSREWANSNGQSTRVQVTDTHDLHRERMPSEAPPFCPSGPTQDISPPPLQRCFSVCDFPMQLPRSCSISYLSKTSRNDSDAIRPNADWSACSLQRIGRVGRCLPRVSTIVYKQAPMDPQVLSIEHHFSSPVSHHVVLQQRPRKAQRRVSRDDQWSRGAPNRRYRLYRRRGETLDEIAVAEARYQNVTHVSSAFPVLLLG